MTTLIKNGLVYDGVSREPRRADVFFEKDKIRAVGPRPRARADRVVHADGCVVIPGLIDTGSDIDRYGGLFSHDIQKEFLRRGITTVIAGGSGVSLAPFRPDLFRTFFHSSESFAGNADWKSFADFLSVLRKGRLSLHVGAMAGYRNLYSPFVSQREMRERVIRVLEEGALGVSLDWSDPVSYPFSPDAVRALGEALSSSGKVCALGLDSSRLLPGPFDMFRRFFSGLRSKLH
ncbi:MAG: hypothetical protein Q8R20_01680, partial [Nanoarchaeota archaeon]|nr:hypothetical protein [Nanoarchaeota archaeon]